MRQTPAGVQMLVAGVQRARIVRFTQFKPFIEVEIEILADQVGEGLEMEAHMRSVKSLYEKYVESGAGVAPEVAATVSKTDDPVYLADLVSAAPDQTLEQKQHMLETPNVLERLRLLALFLSKQVEILELKAKIQNEVQSTIGKLQRDQILREQLKAIRKELGEDEEGAELHGLREKIEAAGMPDAVKERALKEIDRMQSIPAASPEVGIIRTYVDWLIALPWGPPPGETWDIKVAARVLDEDHYGVEKIKERILEYMAVRQRSQSLRSPILCFVGPPGVGKTSLGKSIARALGRKFVRLSLGGIHDEAEIRLIRHQHVHGERTKAQVDDPDRDLQQRQRAAGQYHGPRPAADRARLHPDPDHIGHQRDDDGKGGDAVEPGRQLVDRGGRFRVIGNPESEHRGIAEPEGQAGKETDLGDIDRVQSPGGIDTVAHRAAGKDAGADIMSDRIAGEGGQRVDAVGNVAAADRANREPIIKCQREITGGNEQRSQHDLMRLGAFDGLDHLIDIDVPEHVVKHIARDADDRDADQHTKPMQELPLAQ